MAERRAHRPLTRERALAGLETLFIYVVLLAGAIVVMVPLWWMVTTSIPKPSCASC